MRAQNDSEKFTLAISKYDVVLFALLHGATWLLFAVSLITAPAWLLLLPISLLLARAHYLYLQDGSLWLLPPTSFAFAATGLPSGRHWQLCSRQGEWQLAILDAAFVHPWLTVLDFSHASGSYRVLIWPDSVIQAQRRRLRLICAIVADVGYLGNNSSQQYMNGNVTIGATEKSRAKPKTELT